VSEQRLQIEPTDEQLARKAGAGCSSAFAELIDRFEPRVRGFVARYRLGAADTDDVVQETFLHAWAGIARYDPERRFSTWLLTIAARRAITQIRAATSRRSAAPILECDLAALNGEDREERHTDAGGTLWDLAAHELPTDQHAALWLRYVEDLSAKQIGAVLGKSQVAVRVMLFRARERLARAIEEDDGVRQPETQPRSRANTLGSAVKKTELSGV